MPTYNWVAVIADRDRVNSLLVRITIENGLWWIEIGIWCNIGIKSRIYRPVAIQSSNVIARFATNFSEVASHINPIVNKSSVVAIRASLYPRTIVIIWVWWKSIVGLFWTWRKTFYRQRFRTTCIVCQNINYDTLPIVPLLIVLRGIIGVRESDSDGCPVRFCDDGLISNRDFAQTKCRASLVGTVP